MKPSESQKNWLGKLAQRYHDALTPEVRTYLEGRALGPDAVTGSLLGLVADPDPVHEPYVGRLSIPFLTPTGVISMRFRCLKDHDCKEHGHGKYESPAGERTHLFNVQALHDATTEVGICEGELDALVATSAGVPSVGCVGASNWKPFYYRLFHDFERVYVMGDGDQAGRKWAGGLVANIAGAVSRVMPSGHDVSSYVMEHGPEAFMKSVCDTSNSDT